MGSDNGQDRVAAQGVDVGVVVRLGALDGPPSSPSPKTILPRSAGERELGQRRYFRDRCWPRALLERRSLGAGVGTTHLQRSAPRSSGSRSPWPTAPRNRQRLAKSAPPASQVAWSRLARPERVADDQTTQKLDGAEVHGIGLPVVAAGTELPAETPLRILDQNRSDIRLAPDSEEPGGRPVAVLGCRRSAAIPRPSTPSAIAAVAP